LIQRGALVLGFYAFRYPGTAARFLMTWIMEIYSQPTMR
jgi:hypothetical protein